MCEYITQPLLTSAIPSTGFCWSTCNIPFFAVRDTFSSCHCFRLTGSSLLFKRSKEQIYHNSKDFCISPIILQSKQFSWNEQLGHNMPINKPNRCRQPENFSTYTCMKLVFFTNYQHYGSYSTIRGEWKQFYSILILVWYKGKSESGDKLVFIQNLLYNQMCTRSDTRKCRRVLDTRRVIGGSADWCTNVIASCTGCRLLTASRFRISFHLRFMFLYHPED